MRARVSVPLLDYRAISGDSTACCREKTGRGGRNCGLLVERALGEIKRALYVSVAKGPVRYSKDVVVCWAWQRGGDAGVVEWMMMSEDVEGREAAAAAGSGNKCGRNGERAGWKGCVVACAAGKADAGFELDYWSPDRLGER